jgi:transposase
MVVVEYTSVTCPGCGARLEVALQVSMVLVDSGVVRATATGSCAHVCHPDDVNPQTVVG